mgnify:CR=1 FL=1
MRVAIVGCRSAKNININKIAALIPKGCVEIVSGGSTGIDHAAEIISKKIGVKLTVFLPDYKKYGKRACIIRNSQIVKNSDIVYAFWDYKSRGTANTIVQCINNNIMCRIFSINEFLL